ncbi:hypothetical protein [Dactylosporangium sp. CA-092794]|uniref:hypothetical protein n=1 Tax=Dactylosporangium sp. CA-092794 TaxID=3239929 RepID=UPI003D8B57EC
MAISTLPQRPALDLDDERTSVLLVAAAHRLTDLGRHLPPQWLVIRREALAADGRDPDIVVLDDPAARTVSAACMRHPTSAIVAVLGPYSDHQRVVDVLEAGADACVRSATAAVIAAHLEACQRRQAA